MDKTCTIALGKQYCLLPLVNSLENLYWLTRRLRACLLACLFSPKAGQNFCTIMIRIF